MAYVEKNERDVQHLSVSFKLISFVLVVIQQF